MKKEYINTFQSEGLIRISRLSYYHDVENLGQAIGDKDEGKSFVDLKIKHFEKTAENKPPSALSILFGEMGNGATVKNLNLSNATISNSDYFCLCLSEKLDKSLLSEFDADGFFTVRNPLNFFNAISTAIGKYNYSMFGKCEYSGRKKTYDDDNHDDEWKKFAFLKDSGYKHQKEVRAIWSIPSIKEDHIYIKCREATKYCKFS